jgi:hypothetical protein
MLIEWQNWFQNRRAKVKQDKKKAANQYQMTMSMAFGHPHMPVVSGQFAHPHPQEQQYPPQMHMQAPDYYPVNADISPASHPVQNLDGPSALDLGSQISLQQQQQSYDMQHTLRSIPEANRTASYHPNPSAMMHTIMAATNGAYMHNSGMPARTQDGGFPYNSTGMPNSFSDDLAFAVPTTTNSDLAPSHPEFTGFADFNVDYSALASTSTDNSTPIHAQQSTSSVSSAPSPFSGAQPNGANRSPNGPTPSSIASVTSLYSGWTDERSQLAQRKQEDEVEDPFAATYNLTQASTSEQRLPIWAQSGSNQMYPDSNFYQQSNASAHAVLSSPEQDQSRKFSGAPSDFDLSIPFHEDSFARRNSSTSNLATNMDAIHIRNGTPDEFKQPNQPSSIAARRQKRPIALNSTAMRSASYSAALPSPGGNGDHTLRRIRSSGIPNAAGRVQKSQPSSAQRSPMTMNFSDAAASPKFARAFSSSSATTVGQGGSLCPPTPLTPQEFGGNLWQNGTVIRSHSVMPEHNSPESMHTNWSSDLAGNVLAKSGSPPSTSLDLQARFINDAMYRDTPPQSAPATQQNFPTFMQRPQMRTGFHSTTDLTIQQPKPSHFRRPSLPNSAQGQGEESNVYFQGGDLSFDDFKDVSLDGIHHNVPFAPPQHLVPQFLVHEYSPPQDPHGNLGRRMAEPQPKNYIFANQGPGDFRA